MKVAILGCGPTGLIAALAAETLGHEVVIYSRKKKSQTFGAMYLHMPIPGISPEEPEMEIQVVKMGSREGYAMNVYGDVRAKVSWDKFQDGPTPGWDLALAYDKLWLRYDHKIVDIALTGRIVDQLANDHDIIFSTIDRRVLCECWLHEFTGVEIAVVHGPLDDEHRWNVMYYNGLPPNGLGSWYRYSVIRGYQSWEYSLFNLPTFLQGERVREGLFVVRGIKPLATNCNCRPEIHRLGRFGKWHKHAFTHHSWQEVRDALQQLR